MFGNNILSVCVLEDNRLSGCGDNRQCGGGGGGNGGEGSMT